MGFDYSCYDPCRDKTGKRWIGYYLTAYNIAVKHGFVGTEEEWLESLQGKSVMLRYNAETETLQWAYENTDDWKDILDINDLRSEIVSQTLDEANAAKTGAETAQGKAESAQEAAESAQTAAETAKGLAETAASDAASSAGAAEGSAGSAASSAQSAAQSAKSAMEYAGKPSKVEDGTWRVWNAASQAYIDTGVKAYTNPMGAYDPDTAYSLLDVVSYEGASYLALKDVQGVAPSNDGTNWMLLTEKGDTGLAVGSVVKTGGTGAPGTTDTYTVYLTDNTPVGTITVYNGKDGNGDFKADGSVPMTGTLQMGGHKLTGLAEGTADTDGVNKGQMDAAIAALTGEDIPTSGTDETTIAAALSNKAEWNGGFLSSGSILDWAEAQTINTHVATNSGVTGFLYATAWAVDFYLYPASGWRRLIATDIQLGVSYYCIKNASQPWSTWTSIATATPPNGYNLPLTDGISVQAGLVAVYSKDQFGQVIVLGSLSGQMPDGAVVATLPSGFRPIYTFETTATCDFDAGRIQVNSLGEIRVRSKLSECSSFSFLAVFVAGK